MADRSCRDPGCSPQATCHLLFFNQLNEHHFCIVTQTWTQLMNAGVSTRTIRITRCNVIKQFHYSRGIAQPGSCQTPGMYHGGIAFLVTALCQGDQALSLTSDCQCFCLRGLYSLVFNQLRNQDSAQSSAFVLAAAKFFTCYLVSHIQLLRFV